MRENSKRGKQPHKSFGSSMQASGVDTIMHGTLRESLLEKQGEDTRHKIEESMDVQANASGKPKPIEKMLKSITPRRTNPILKLGFFSKLFFFWINPLFEIGSERTLQPSDLFQVPKPLEAKTLGKLYRDELAAHPKADHVKLAYQIIRPRYVMGVCMYVLGATTQIIAPIIFNEYLHIFQTTTDSGDHYFKLPLFLIFLIFLDLLVRQLLLNQAMFHINANGTRLAVMLRHEIYMKMLNMNVLHLDHFVETPLVNLLTIDIDNLTGGLIIIPNFISAFVMLLGQFYFLYSLGNFTLILVFMLILVVMILKSLHSNTKNARLRLLRYTDNVSRIMREFIQNIVNVKINRFEEVFYNRLLRHKEKESAAYRSYLRWSQTASILNFIFPSVFGLVFFLLIILGTGQREITIEETYVILTVLSIMRTPLSMITEGFDKYPEYTASRLRIEGFLNKILEKNKKSYQDPTINLGEIQIESANFGFDPFEISTPKSAESPNPHHVKHSKSKKLAEPPAILKDISLNILSGSSAAIVGPLGAGKTFLFWSILGETKLKKGSIKLNGKCYFVPEEFCFTEDTVFQNIVCGRDYNEEKYKKALKYSKLEEHLHKLEGADGLILKDNGNNITHKIKQRVILARMLYEECDIYLIDGFLDDLDIDFREYFVAVVIREVLKTKTFIINTDRVDICRLVDRIIVMSEGRIIQRGPFKKLADDKEGVFRVLMANPLEMFLKLELEKASYGRRAISQNSGSIHGGEIGYAKEQVELQHKLVSSAIHKHSKNPYPPIHSSRHWVTIFSKFFFSQGKCLPLTYVSFLVASQLLIYTFTWYITEWKTNRIQVKDPGEYVVIFIGIISIAFFTLITTSYVFIRYIRIISFRLFLFMVRSLVSRDLEWFKNYPSSKILNIFITDYNEVDQLLGPSLHSFLQVFFRLNVGVFVILYKTYIMGTTIVFVHLMVLRYLYVFLRTDRCLKQILVRERSHVVTSIMDSYKGLIHYRNSRLTNYLANNFFAVHDIFQNTKTADNNFAQRWLMARICGLVQWYPVLVLLDAVAKVLIHLEPDFTLHALKFTIALDMCFTAMPLINSFVRNETFYSDIERIFNYTNLGKNTEEMVKKNLLHRDSFSLEEKSIFDGSIKFERLSYCYPEMRELALTDASFEIKVNEKVALVGSPGSGKHTVLSLLAGLTIPKYITAGRIIVGGKVVTDKMINQLGETIFCLNSDYVLFEGDLRTNIDPTRKYSDMEIIKVFTYLGFWNLDNKPGDQIANKEKLAWERNVRQVGEDLGAMSEKEAKESKISFKQEDSLLKDNKTDKSIAGEEGENEDIEEKEENNTGTKDKFKEMRGDRNTGQFALPSDISEVLKSPGKRPRNYSSRNLIEDMTKKWKKPVLEKQKSRDDLELLTKSKMSEMEEPEDSVRSKGKKKLAVVREIENSEVGTDNNDDFGLQRKDSIVLDFKVKLQQIKNELLQLPNSNKLSKEKMNEFKFEGMGANDIAAILAPLIPVKSPKRSNDKKLGIVVVLPPELPAAAQTKKSDDELPRMELPPKHLISPPQIQSINDHLQNEKSSNHPRDSDNVKGLHIDVGHQRSGQKRARRKSEYIDEIALNFQAEFNFKDLKDVHHKPREAEGASGHLHFPVKENTLAIRAEKPSPDSAGKKALEKNREYLTLPAGKKHNKKSEKSYEKSQGIVEGSLAG